MKKYFVLKIKNIEQKFEFKIICFRFASESLNLF